VDGGGIASDAWGTAPLEAWSFAARLGGLLLERGEERSDPESELASAIICASVGRATSN